MVNSIECEVLEPITEVDKFGLMVAQYTVQQGHYDIANRILDDLRAETPVRTIEVEISDRTSEEIPMLVQEANKPMRRVESALENLTQSAGAELEQLELVIKKGLDAWYEIGKAFETISKKKLFGVIGYKSFKEYLRKRWGKAECFAFSYITAARVKDEISEYIEIRPGQMTHYRELHRLPSLEDRVALWDELAATGKKPTVAVLRRAIDKRLGTQPKPKTTTTVKVSVESAELLQALAEQGQMTQAQIVEKLLAKLMQD